MNIRLLLATLVLLFWAPWLFATEHVRLEVGEMYQTELASPIAELVLSHEQSISTEWSEQRLVVFANQPGVTELFWQTETGERASIQVLVVPPHRNVLLGFLTLFAQTNRVHQIESNAQIWLHGTVSAQSYRRYQALAEQFSGLNLSQLEVQQPPQQMLELEVNVVEVRRRFLRNHGLSWSPALAGPAVGVLSDWLGGGSFRLMSDLSSVWQPAAAELADSMSAGTRGYLGWQTSLTSTLRLLEERGEANLLATPKLRVQSGQTTEFLAGGEIPLPQVNADGQMQVAFHPYGIRVQATPEYLENGKIQALIEAEVSSLDAAVAVQGIPGLLTRRSASTVTIQAGETLVLSGLKSREAQYQRSGVPGATGTKNGLFGFLGSATEQGRQETEMMVFITPRVLAEEKQKAEQQQQRRERRQEQLRKAPCRGVSVSAS